MNLPIAGVLHALLLSDKIKEFILLSLPNSANHKALFLGYVSRLKPKNISYLTSSATHHKQMRSTKALASSPSGIVF